MLRLFIVCFCLNLSIWAQSALQQVLIAAQAPASGVTWTIIQNPCATNNSGTTIAINSGTTTCTGMVATTAGNLLWLLVANNANSSCPLASSVTETGASDTWTYDTHIAANTYCTYYVLNGAGGATAVSVAGLANNDNIAILIEAHRSTGTASIDVNASESYNGGSTSYSSGAVTTTSSTGLLLGGIWDLTTNTPSSLTPTGGFSLQTSIPNANIGWFLGVTVIKGSSAGSHNNTGTVGGSDGIVSSITTFK